jgi:hypothetical protein
LWHCLSNLRVLQLFTQVSYSWRLQHQQEKDRGKHGKLFGAPFAASAEGMAALRSTARQLLQALDHLHS